MNEAEPCMSSFQPGKLLAILFLVLCFCTLSCGKTADLESEKVEVTISQYVRSHCADIKDCRLSIGEVLQFPWDEMYFFDYKAETEEVSKALGFEYIGRSREFSRKWIFLLHKQIVKIEEYPVFEIDRPFTSGDIDIDISNNRERFARFTRRAEFTVDSVDVDSGNFFRLSCSNCEAAE